MAERIFSLSRKPPILEIVNDSTTEEERRYTEMLFDFESVRQNW